MRWLIATLFIGCFLSVTSLKRVKRNKPSEITGIRIIDGLCMNLRSDRLVYRFKNDTYVYVAFDVLKTGMVDVFSWDIIKATKGTFISSKMKEERVLAIDFRKRVNRQHVLGTTNKRHQKRFKHRMERKMTHCRRILKEKNKHCKLTAIQGALARMSTDIRNVTFKENLEDCDN